MRDHRLLKLFCVIFIRVALLLTIVSAQLGKQYIALVQIPTPAGVFRSACGKGFCRGNNYAFGWFRDFWGPATFECWVKPYSDLWQSTPDPKQCAEWNEAFVMENGITVYTPLPGLRYHHGAGHRYLHIAHAWVIGFFAVLTAVPFVRRFIRRWRSSHTKETS